MIMDDSLKIGHIETPGLYPGVKHVVTGYDGIAEPICGTRGGYGFLCFIDSKTIDPNLIECKKCLAIIKKESKESKNKLNERSVR